MSGVTDRLVIPGLNGVEQGWLDLLWERLWKRRDRNLLRASYYDGKHAMDSLALLAPQYRTLGAVLGWTGKSVDMLVRRCNPEGFFWADGDLEQAGFTQYSEANNLLAQIKSGLVSSAVHGVSFLVTTQGDTAAGEPASLLTVKDALNSTGEWSSRRRALDALLSVTSWDDDSRRPSGLVLYLDGLTVTADRGPDGWVVSRQTHQWGVPADPLIYKPRTGREFGGSRITRPQMFLQDRAVQALLRMEGHMDTYSTPQMFLLGADESIFKNADGSMKPSWKIALGRVFGIPDDQDRDDSLARAEVKQFQASSPEPHLAQLSALAKLFAREAHLPDSALAITDMANPTSADAYVAANDDLIAEAEGATDDWSLPIRRAVARGLAIQADEPVSDELRTIGVRWRNPVHVSRAAAADAGAKQIATIPWLGETRTGLRLLGLSDSDIDEALAERSRVQNRSTLEQILARRQAPTVTDAVAG